MVIENRGPELRAVDCTFLITAVAATALRCYVRIGMVKAFGIDDYIMVFATITYVLYCSFSINGIAHGTGRHSSDLTEENAKTAMRNWWLCYLFYCTTMISSKISIGYFLLRVTIRRLHAWIIYTAVTLSIVAGLAFFFVTLFQCHPISYFWDKFDQQGTCVNIEIIIALGYLYSSFSVLSDFTLAILPAFLISGLKMNRRTKIMLIPLMAMGTIASGAVIARMPYLVKFRNPDFLWVTLDIAIWSTVEQGLAITAGSLATTRPLLRFVTQKFGLSKPTELMRPSKYGAAGASNWTGGLSHSRKGSKGPRDMYSLSRMGDKDSWDDGADNGQEIGFHTMISSSGKSSPMPNKIQKKRQRSDSEEELQEGEISKEDFHETRIVIAKSFLTTEERRGYS